MGKSSSRKPVIGKSVAERVRMDVRGRVRLVGIAARVLDVMYVEEDITAQVLGQVWNPIVDQIWSPR